MYLQSFLSLFAVSGLAHSIATTDDFTQIPCSAQVEQGVRYRKISWYKVQEGSDELRGLIIKDLRTNISILYKFANLSYGVEEDFSLLFPSPVEVDCERYRCILWPPVGHRIQEGDQYFPEGCHQTNTALLVTQRSSSRQHLLPVVVAGVVILVLVLSMMCVSLLRRQTHNKVLYK